jgi:hypothetical protein
MLHHHDLSPIIAPLPLLAMRVPVLVGCIFLASECREIRLFDCSNGRTGRAPHIGLPQVYGWNENRDLRISGPRNLRVDEFCRLFELCFKIAANCENRIVRKLPGNHLMLGNRKSQNGIANADSGHHGVFNRTG